MNWWSSGSCNIEPVHMIAAASPVCGCGRVIESRDGLLMCALYPVNADDDVRMKNLTRREGARPAWESRIGLNITHGGTKSNAHAGGSTCETEEHGVVIPTVDLVIWRIMIFSMRTPTYTQRGNLYRIDGK